MEILDLYDNNFNKLNKTMVRRVDEIPENTNIMLSYAIIKNGNKFLLEQTTIRNDYKWCFAGGHLQHNETALVALKRELFEELGLINIKISKLDTVKYPEKNFIFNIYLITDKIDTSKLKYQLEEVNATKWFTKKELLKMVDNDLLLQPHKFIVTNYIVNNF